MAGLIFHGVTGTLRHSTSQALDEAASRIATTLFPVRSCRRRPLEKGPSELRLDAADGSVAGDSARDQNRQQQNLQHEVRGIRGRPAVDLRQELISSREIPMRPDLAAAKQ